MKTTNGHTNTNTMDDSDHICPLCCEEMDISDREFYPCKCGYQVCIWCWHKIRKSENGLCPACRTPYGEDPHQFTALDVEEVLRANKEAQAAAKREKQIQNQLLQQQQQQQQQLQQAQQHNSHHNLHSTSSNTSGNPNGAVSSASHAMSSAVSLSSNIANSHDTMSTSFDAATDTAPSNNVDGPKDRTSLANLRVIRRNLIYAVGLPPNIANEETLRKPEYFGQYGKLTKVVVNRSSPGGGDSNDPRRASSSAYITFQFKEDTLACILALDGFHIDNRTIRASYGTSKYCSAFMKHVRCSNPDCTYLHEMGASEDTFTKQEIQAGYVTSGCDVLARQQQILVEQQKLSGGHSMLSATGTKLPTRKRTGGGGPSGTGKPHPNPIFPAPEFEEPIRQQAVPSMPPPSAITKASTLGNPPKITQSYVNATNVPAKVGRTTSAGVLPVASSNNNTSPTIGGGINPPRKSQSGIAATSTNAAPNPTTAASVVASRRVAASKDGTDAAQQHSTLTALTPLKRNTTTSKGKPLSAVNEDENVTGSNKIPGVRNGKKQSSSSGGRSAALNFPTSIGQPNKSNSTTTTTTVSALSELQPSSDTSNIIGGDVIGPSTLSLNGWNSGKPLNFGNATSAMSNANNTIGSSSSTSSLAELGGMPIPIPSTTSTGTSTSTILGGDIYTGPLLNQSRDVSTIAGGGGSSLVGGSLLNEMTLSSATNVVGGEIGLRGGISANLWSGSILGGSSTTSLGAGTGSSSNNTGVIGSHISNSGLNSSSALASILGINLPTGSGSLQESLWSPSPHQHTGPSPLSMLNESTIQENQYNQSQQFNGGMGSQLRTGVGPLQPPIQNTSIIGNRGQARSSSNNNVPIGAGPGMIGGSGSSQVNSFNQQHQQQSDIALLQILLPGVHITSDHNDSNSLRGGVPGWGSEPSAIGRHHGQQSIGSNRTGMIGSGSGNWVGGDGSSNNKAMGGSVIGQPNYAQHQPKQQQNSNQGSGIW